MITKGRFCSQRIRKQSTGFCASWLGYSGIQLHSKNCYFANWIIFSLQIFLGALAFTFFAKGLSGSYMKSMSSQIERRFEISSSIVGIIDGSFEIGTCTSKVDQCFLVLFHSQKNLFLCLLCLLLMQVTWWWWCWWATLDQEFTGQK